MPVRATTETRCKFVEKEEMAFAQIRPARATAKKISGSRTSIKATLTRKTRASVRRLLRHVSAHTQHAASNSRPEIAKTSIRTNAGHKTTSGLSSNRLSARSNNNLQRKLMADVRMTMNRKNA